MLTIPISQAQTQITKLLADIEDLGEEVVITRSGRPIAVLLASTEYEGLVETLEILADQHFAKKIERGLEEAAAGKLLRHGDVWDGLDTHVQGVMPHGR